MHVTQNWLLRRCLSPNSNTQISSIAKRIKSTNRKLYKSYKFLRDFIPEAKYYLTEEHLNRLDSYRDIENDEFEIKPTINTISLKRIENADTTSSSIVSYDDKFHWNENTDICEKPAVIPHEIFPECSLFTKCTLPRFVELVN